MTDVLYQGRLWDAPATDGATEAELFGEQCMFCEELIDHDDDAVRMSVTAHVECWLRMAMGDVAHLEGRCLCQGGTDHDEEGTYRDQSKRVVAWLVEHGKGRWHA